MKKFLCGTLENRYNRNRLKKKDLKNRLKERKTYETKNVSKNRKR